MGFSVFIERAYDGSAAGLERTAQTLSLRYGFPAAQILERLRGGRFAAWNGLDRSTAERCADELDGFGLQCSVVDEAAPAATPHRAPPLPSPPRSGSSSRPPPVPGTTSGLAAYGTAAPEQGLGALSGRETDAGWQVTALDGTIDDHPTTVAAGSLTPPPGARESGAGRRDLFAPPDAGREVALELDAPDRPRRDSTPAAAPAPAPASPSDASFSRPRHAPVSLPAPPDPRGLGDAVGRAALRLADGTPHLIAGALLAVLLGLLPAHLVAAAREDAYAEVRAGLEREYAAIDSGAAWDRAADSLAAARAAVDQRRTNVAITSAVLWLLAAAGVAWAWFRGLDWDALIRRFAPR